MNTYTVLILKILESSYIIIIIKDALFWIELCTIKFAF
jgi:hypothetical protein